MAREQLAVMELLWGMITGKTGPISRIDYFPQKPAWSENEAESTPLVRATPESQGISSDMLCDMLKDLRGRTEMDMHQFLMLRNGKVICECSFSPYQTGMWHISHSMCKSVTGMAVGLLISEGKLSLDDRVIDIFGKRKSFFGVLRQREITVRHLLTMTSNVAFNELGIFSGNEWTKGFLESGVHDVSGEVFEYNSMNSYMLSAMITEITGETMMEYLRPRLWEPLGIRRVFWECSPQNVTKGGWGLFIRPEDAAKLGQLYLQKGMWNKEQIIPEEWVLESVKRQVDTKKDQPEAGGYGYQIWQGIRPGSFNFNGMLGQNVIVYPDLDIVMVTNAANRELFQNGTMREIIEGYFHENFCPPEVLPEDKCAYSKLKALEKCLSEGGMKVPGIEKGGWRKHTGVRPGAVITRESIKKLSGNVYELEQQNVGIFPLMMQVFHNNFTDGIRRIGFRYADGRFYMDVWEGECRQEIEIGINKAVSVTIIEHDEPYLAKVTGEFTSDEERRLVLKIDIAFLEEAARRKMKVYFSNDKDKIEIRWDEIPGEHVILSGLDAVTDESKNGFFLNSLKEAGGMEMMKMAVRNTVQPVTYGMRTQE